MRPTPFERYWNSVYSPSSMPGIFNEAMKEIAYRAWNAALDKATEIVSEESDLDVIPVFIKNQKFDPNVKKPVPVKSEWENLSREKWNSLLDIIQLDGLEPIERGFGTHIADETYQIQETLYKISIEYGFSEPIEILFKKIGS